MVDLARAMEVRNRISVYYLKLVQYVIMYIRIKKILRQKIPFLKVAKQRSPSEAERTKNAYLPIFHLRRHRRIFPQIWVKKKKQFS